MSFDGQYDCDVEFLKLLMRHNDIDLTILALELARDADPELDFQASLDWIDARAEELAGPVARAKNETAMLAEFGRCIAEKHGLFGDKQSYDRAESSFLNRVIETKRGIPISLSLLYMAVGERLGIDLKGVSAPMHFLARYESVDGPLFVDAFSHGRVLNYDDCQNWLKKLLNRPEEDLRQAIRPAEPRLIAIRMLNNLKSFYARQENWSASWQVQHRLTALQPGSYEERRDLAVISLHANRPGHAVDLLKSCLRVCPEEESERLSRHLEDAQVQISRWN